jgi:hyperosmotically inducible protein
MPKEISMRNLSILRKTLIASGVMMTVAVLPLSMAMAQDTSSSSAMQSSSATPSSSNETVPGKVDDTWITTKVKSQLAAAKGVKSSDISVSTADGVVTLTGTVASSRQRSRVEHIAKQVKGVKSVDGSGLTVSATSSSSSTPASSSSASGH